MKAVAAGAASPAPFFDERSGLGRDADVRSRPAHGGLQQGDTPGLYGGTDEAAICDVEQLKRYLAEPRNGRKARAWAGALDLRTDGIPEYLDGLTPVLLRHDTLVRNHDYEKGKAVPFDALLQAGIAILVDEQGMPAVKCSCGNPLRPFEGDKNRISVSFDDGNEQWKGYDRSEVVVVRPASHELERIALVDVEDPDRGIERPVGTTGEEDTAFDTRRRQAVPSLIGTTFGEASRRLAGRGLAVAYDGEGVPPDGARVTASDPAAGAELRFGTHVTLSVVKDGSPAGGGTAPPDPESSRPTTGPASPSSPSSPPAPSAPSSGPSRSERPASPSGTPEAPSTPADSAPPPPPGTSSGPPPSTRSAPPETPGTASAPPRATPPPPTGGPASGAPATSVPATPEAPTTSAPAERPRRTPE
ncbi:DUF6777 domain-containing protein [Streptomyces sp. NPDC057236]|uniref:DUF6777 domain-containing protein n=1 Tax=Streptomyces sp. NPDC057236 TaxID=3346059 RepID=UPI00362B6685